MATKWTIGADAADPQRLARFWAAALDYVIEPGFDDPDGSGIIDPDDIGPAIGPELGHIVMLDPEGNEFCVG